MNDPDGMSKNIEIKARIDDIAAMLSRASALADVGPVNVAQDDTFFACKTGRLKLRVTSPEHGELIYYRRGDTKGPKESLYLITPTLSPGRLRRLLSLAYGETGRVKKHRTIFIAGRTRIHIDHVEGLGDFVELEAVLDRDEQTEAGQAVLDGMMEKLGVSPDHLIEGAYIDLLKAGTEE